MICRKSNGIISLTFGDLERSDQGHLLKNRLSVRDSAIVTEEHIIVAYRSRIKVKGQGHNHETYFFEFPDIHLVIVGIKHKFLSHVPPEISY